MKKVSLLGSKLRHQTEEGDSGENICENITLSANSSCQSQNVGDNYDLCQMGYFFAWFCVIDL